jgi:signal transduction histidine kinase
VPFAVLDHAAALVPAPSVIEAVGAQIQLSLLRSRRSAEAAARLAELRALQRALLDAQDAARRRIERDLHDGAQQQLVGLALRARLDARANDDDARRELAVALEHEAGALEAAIVTARPAVLGGGLAAAFATLCSSAPIPVDLEVDGDLAGDHPVAVDAWFVAVDAIANVLKHSGARRGSIALRVGVDHVEVAVGDDGIGGVALPPRSIGDRVERAGGEVAIRSTPGVGTIVRVRLPREPATVGVGS